MLAFTLLFIVEIFFPFSFKDGMHLMLGNYTVRDGEGNLIPSPLVTDRGWRYNTVSSNDLCPWRFLF